MNPLSDTGMALAAPLVQCKNVRMWVSGMEESSKICHLWREELTKAWVGTWMEAKRAVCLSEDRGSCVFLYEVSSLKYILLAKDKRQT